MYFFSMMISDWHCPLCIRPLVNPKDVDRKPVLLFLDMDGVLFFETGSLQRKIQSVLAERFPEKEGIYSDRDYLAACNTNSHK